MPSQPPTPLFTIRASPIHGAGLGMFATKPIPRGTLILREASLFTVPTPMVPSTPTTETLRRAIQIHRKLTRLTAKKRSIFAGLSTKRGAPKRSQAAKDVRRRKGGVRKRAGRVRKRAGGIIKKRGAVSARVTKDRFAKKPALNRLLTNTNTNTTPSPPDLSRFDTNAFTLLSSPTSPATSTHPNHQTESIFPTIARINHSCLPNASATHNPHTGHLSIYALTCIPRGAEITIEYYNDDGWRGTGERRARLGRRMGLFAGVGFVGRKKGGARRRRRERLGVLYGEICGGEGRKGGKRRGVALAAEYVEVMEEEFGGCAEGADMPPLVDYRLRDAYLFMATACRRARKKDLVEEYGRRAEAVHRVYSGENG